ncbi:hypothetical protein OIV19_11905 [Brucella sp. HL-2]|nr:hypothetical protein [Brucella sp. HL-2]MCV9908316.1 hypothetical protein [Brucella sp. HL-2]
MSSYGGDNGRVSKPGKLFEHWCDAEGCKAWGSFGYKTKYGQLWFCRVHKQEGEDALAGRR